MGRTLIIIGLALVALGILVTLGERLPIRLGRLPGDIVIRGKNTVFYFPIVTSRAAESVADAGDVAVRAALERFLI